MLVGALERRIESARQHVLLNLAVPFVGHELPEPFGKARQFGGRKAGNKGFNFFNAHVRKLRSRPASEKKSFLNCVEAGKRLIACAAVMVNANRRTQSGAGGKSFSAGKRGGTLINAGQIHSAKTSQAMRCFQ